MRLTVCGKFFHLDGRPHFLRTVTYGPFAPESIHCHKEDFRRIRAANFNSVRVYSLPDRTLLDSANEHQLLVIVTHAWAHGCDFLGNQPELLSAARRQLESWLSEFSDHPALGAVLVANEIPSEIAQWMSPRKTREAIDQLILSAKKIAPKVPVGYASFPTTEYLEPIRADFTAMNVYLEDPKALSSYLPRIHHLAGDRPVFLTEIGLDTFQNTEEQQAGLLPKALQLCREAGLAGATIYSWSDDWFNNGQSMTDWAFGLVRRDGSEKPALKKIRDLDLPHPIPRDPPFISVAVCTRNGAERLTNCLTACLGLDYPNFEIIVINDGSTDSTASVLEQVDGIRTFNIPPSGLSAARNFAAREAKGEIIAFTDDDCQPDRDWLAWLSHTFSKTDDAAIGGPNLAPSPDSASLAQVTSAPGAPTHVMLDDTSAEHLPGCNLAVRLSAFQRIDGFDPLFETAGDDVDFCWRLRDAGFTLGFSPGAFVWHHRRPTPWQYLKQQMGYGRAEALLYRKHPHRFSEGGITWQGFVYRGLPMSVMSGDFIYSGPTGEAPYQSLAQPSRPFPRPMPTKFDSPINRGILHLLAWLQRHLRSWSRKKHGGPAGRTPAPPQLPGHQPYRKMTLIADHGISRSHLYQVLKENSWQPCDHPDFDLELGETQLFAATEQTGTSRNRTYLRFTGSDREIRKVIAGAGFHILK